MDYTKNPKLLFVEQVNKTNNTNEITEDVLDVKRLYSNHDGQYRASALCEVYDPTPRDITFRYNRVDIADVFRYIHQPQVELQTGQTSADFSKQFKENYGFYLDDLNYSIYINELSSHANIEASNVTYIGTIDCYLNRPFFEKNETYPIPQYILDLGCSFSAVDARHSDAIFAYKGKHYVLVVDIGLWLCDYGKKTKLTLPSTLICNKINTVNFGINIRAFPSEWNDTIILVANDTDTDVSQFLLLNLDTSSCTEICTVNGSQLVASAYRDGDRIYYTHEDQYITFSRYININDNTIYHDERGAPETTQLFLLHNGKYVAVSKTKNAILILDENFNQLQEFSGYAGKPKILAINYDRIVYTTSTPDQSFTCAVLDTITERSKAYHSSNTTSGYVASLSNDLLYCIHGPSLTYLCIANILIPLSG